MKCLLDIKDADEEEDEEEEDDEEEEVNGKSGGEPSQLLSTVEEVISHTGFDSTTTDLTLDGLKLDPHVIGPRLAQAFPKLEALSLQDLELTTHDHLQQTAQLVKQLPHLRALWLNGNPFMAIDDVSAAHDQGHESLLKDISGGLQIFNRDLTERYSGWALLYLASSSDPCEVESLDLSNRNLSALKPEVFQHFTLLRRLNLQDNAKLLMGAWEDKVLLALKKLPSLQSLKTDPLTPGIEQKLLRELPQLCSLNGRTVERKGDG